MFDPSRIDEKMNVFFFSFRTGFRKGEGWNLDMRIGGLLG